MEWMKTSASSTSARSAVLPASERRSSTTLRLPRFTFTKTPLIPGAGPTEMKRVLSPPGGSILITSAPMSAMLCGQYGPITIAGRSTTITPDSGPLDMNRPLFGHREAVADVVAVAVGHDGKDDRRRRVADRSDVFAHLCHRPRRPVHAGRLADDGPGYPTGESNEYFPSDRTGFVCQPPDHGCRQFGAHRRIGGGVDALRHS